MLAVGIGTTLDPEALQIGAHLNFADAAHLDFAQFAHSGFRAILDLSDWKIWDQWFE